MPTVFNKLFGPLVASVRCRFGVGGREAGPGEHRRGHTDGNYPAPNHSKNRSTMPSHVPDRGKRYRD
jgi:hypothetical protein